MANSFGNNPVSTASILECVDPTEYSLLADASKDGLRLILGCATVNMGEGSVIRSWLLDTIFPSGTSHDAIAAKFLIV